MSTLWHILWPVLVVALLARPALYLVCWIAFGIIGVYYKIFPRRSYYACPVCGYDVRETLHFCPECGTELRWGELP